MDEVYYSAIVKWMNNNVHQNSKYVIYFRKQFNFKNIEKILCNELKNYKPLLQNIANFSHNFNMYRNYRQSLSL